MSSSEETRTSASSIRGMSGAMSSMDKMMPQYNDIMFWLVANVVLFLYVGITQLAFGWGPGALLSSGAVLLAFIYLLLWMYRGRNKKSADMWIMAISGLAVVGDLVVLGLGTLHGAFTGASAILDVAGLMLFRATYMENHGKM